MARQKLCDESAVDVIAATRTVANQHAQRLAAVEILDRLSLGRRHEQEDRRGPDRKSTGFCFAHPSSSSSSDDFQSPDAEGALAALNCCEQTALDRRICRTGHRRSHPMLTQFR